eukprot:TRINITY_DN16288_c1_g1_i1.p1 TRINITY_DN16288_c1_g1~~TRINITY_DN16288_c1_g1_i1.p1  ORF type:complete len:742 (+),score=255.48 TRINITY_DN16288_c1_g1_i1:82-2307(+)
MGTSTSRVRRGAFEVLSDVSRSAEGVCEAKGRVLCVAASEQAGLILVGTSDAVLSWRAGDCSYYRAFPTGSPVRCLVPSADGAFVVAGLWVDGRPTVRRFLLTRRIAPAAFERLTGSGTVRGGGFKKGLDAALDSTFTIQTRANTGFISPVARRSEGAVPTVATQPPSRLLTFSEEPTLLCICAVPHVVVWDLEEDDMFAMISGGYPFEGAPFEVMDATRHFVQGKGTSLVLRRWDGTKDRTVSMTAPQPITVLLVRNLVVFVASGRTITKVNILSGAELFTWTAFDSVSCMSQIGGILFSASASHDSIQMWDSRNGRKLGGCAVTQTKGVHSQGMCVLDTKLVVADDPEEGRGFQSLVKQYETRVLLGHVPWLREYDSRFRDDYVRKPGMLERALHLTGAGAATLTAAATRPRSPGEVAEDPVQLRRLVDECEGVFDLEHVRMCLRLFNRHDADRNGAIDRVEFQSVSAEVRQALSEAGMALRRVSLTQIEQAFRGWDVRGGLPFEEFVRTLARQYSGSHIAAVREDEARCSAIAELCAGKLNTHQVRQIRAAFRRYDLDGDGQLDKGEIEALWRDVVDGLGRGDGVVSFPAALLERVWGERGDGEAGLTLVNFATAVSRFMSHTQRAALLAVSGRRRSSKGTALWDLPQTDAGNAPVSQAPVARFADGDIPALMRGLRQEQAQKAPAVRPRRESARQRQREAADPRRVVLRISDFPPPEAPAAEHPQPLPSPRATVDTG